MPQNNYTRRKKLHLQRKRKAIEGSEKVTNLLKNYNFTIASVEVTFFSFLYLVTMPLFCFLLYFHACRYVYNTLDIQFVAWGLRCGSLLEVDWKLAGCRAELL
jgi:hypothetical protein